ncbi:hypothetical protein ZOD2009_19583 [Haladaptatus paucihalophilus DX253]|uniref:Outer membrane lipoprotein-sorting protein n=1 Tax=Haladaptatus paucihalophilus DX253 TaxID=797209 RepID=E7QYM6_HALPU|nr:hypothetical protein [Haladaptatus paucihalophilus]EFW90292.1 hypothetical protein ZOD2009_19583 [Haladaptatus paucihalophilus DX253]SHK00335.1 hypothetical protein SAMN05444342_0241 [Haladaptatus paucihalophilus DX253]
MRSRIPVLLTVCLVLAAISGCVGQAPSNGAGSGSPTKTTETTQTASFSDAKAHEVVDDIRAKQRNISTYHAVEVEKRTYHLSNGSTYSRTRKIDTTKKYVDGAMLQRREYFSPRSRTVIENETSFITYDRANGTYRVGNRRSGGPKHYFISGIYEARNEFEAAFEDDSLSYRGTTTVLGHEVYVIEFDNPKDPKNASWYTSKFWIDTESGALVKSKTDYPVPFERTLAELKNGRPTKGTTSDDGAVIKNATVVFTYENLSVNEDLPEGTFEPPENATRNGR